MTCNTCGLAVPDQTCPDCCGINNMNHTPTPWTIRDRSSNPNNGTSWRDLLAKSFDGNDMYVGEALEKDAKFIIQACNAHDALVGQLQTGIEAMKEALRQLAEADNLDQVHAIISGVIAGNELALNTIEKGV